MTYRPGDGDDPAVVADPALAVEHRHLEPRVVGAIAGRPDDGPDAAAGEIKGEGRRGVDCGRSKAVRRLDLAVEAALGRPAVDDVEQPAELEVGQRALVRKRARELQPAVIDAGEPADQPDAAVGQGIEIQRAPLGRADELERGDPARPLDVVDLVVALVEHAGGIHPPLDVAAAVGPGCADVLAHGQRDRSARAVDLVGELDPGRRGADHEHAAVLELIGVAVVDRRERADRGGSASASLGTHGTLHAPVASTTARGVPVAAVGAHQVAGIGAAHRRHPGMGPHRGGDGIARSHR